MNAIKLLSLKLPFVENVREAGVRLGRCWAGQARDDGFCLFQRQFSDNRVEQLVGLDCERPGDQLAVCAHLSNNEAGQGVSASDIYRHGHALLGVSLKGGLGLGLREC